MSNDNLYYLLVDWKLIDKKIKKFPTNIKSNIKRNISLLKYNPNNGTKLDSYKSASLMKKRYKEIEIYYIVENIAVVVLDIKYKGSVKLNDVVSGIKAGKHNKKTTTKQQRVIKSQKALFNKQYR